MNSEGQDKLQLFIYDLFRHKTTFPMILHIFLLQQSPLVTYLHKSFPNGVHFDTQICQSVPGPFETCTSDMLLLLSKELCHLSGLPILTMVLKISVSAFVRLPPLVQDIMTTVTKCLIAILYNPFSKQHTRSISVSRSVTSTVQS